jgi:hypothetical protein
MEGCRGAHFLGRALRDQGHEVRLMPAQYVKPYAKTNKSEIDASALPISNRVLDGGQIHQQMKYSWVMEIPCLLGNFMLNSFEAQRS